MKPESTPPDDSTPSPDEHAQQEQFESILRRIERGDTSVVSEVYWMQHMGLFPPRKP